VSAEQRARFSTEWLAQQAIDYRTTAATPVPEEH
jgi:hypothetical protein